MTLAVADLTGNGQARFHLRRPESRSRGRPVRHQPDHRAGDQSTGLLSPGAVALADLNGNGIPDLIVANSGSNNVLVYPGLGNGQFGPALNGGNGYFVGTNPTGITVANLNGQPDLIVANSGSNDVSILLGQGTGSNFTLIPGPRISTDAGPVAVAVGNILGNGTQDLAVANQQADNVQVFPGVGSGFFSPKATTYPVGQAPDGLFLGDFSGSGTQIATLDGGSNSISLINPSTGGVTQTIPTGGVLPTSGFAGDFTGNGYTDLVVGNTADGRIALFTGGAEGLNLSQSTTSAEVPSPTSLSFAGSERRRAQLLRRHGGSRVGLALELQPRYPGDQHRRRGVVRWRARRRHRAIDRFGAYRHNHRGLPAGGPIARSERLGARSRSPRS